jgi:16S rRNA (guanine966-N2)-methyltransferase
MVRVERGDGVNLLRRLAPGSQQLIFLDPPYESALFEPALKAASQAMHESGCIYLEAPDAWTDEKLEAFNLQVRRFGKAGKVHFHLLGRTGAAGG